MYPDGVVAVIHVAPPSVLLQIPTSLGKEPGLRPNPTKKVLLLYNLIVLTAVGNWAIFFHCPSEIVALRNIKVTIAATERILVRIGVGCYA